MELVAVEDDPLKWWRRVKGEKQVWNVRGEGRPL